MNIIDTLTKQKQVITAANEARLKAEAQIREAENAIDLAVNAAVDAGGEIGQAVAKHQAELTRSQLPTDRIRAIDWAMPDLYFLKGTKPELFDVPAPETAKVTAKAK